MAKKQSQLKKEMSRLMLMDSCMFILHSITLSFLWQTAKARLLHGLLQVRWDLEVLRRTLLMQAQMAAQDCAKVAYDLGLRKVKAYVKGPGNGRESAIRTVHGAGIEVTEIIDVTPLPHNGCRPPKRRRV